MDLDKLLFVKEKESSYTKRQYARLRASLALIMLFACTLYIFIDFQNSIYDYMAWYSGGVFFAFMVLYLNRKQHYKSASALLLLVTNILVFAIASSNLVERGGYFIFITLALMGLVLFYTEDKRLGWFFSSLSLGLAILAYYGNFKFFHTQTTSVTLIHINFTINLLIGLVTSVLILNFVIYISEKTEQNLRANKQSMEGLLYKLGKSEKRFALAAESSKAGIYEYNIFKDTTYVSERWKFLLGFVKERKLEFNLDFFLGLVHPDDRPRVSDLLHESVELGKAFQYEVRLKNSKTGYRWFMDSGSVGFNEGKPEVVIGSIIDITERKNVEQELRIKNEELLKANKELDQFVYSASHDMRAPLSSLLGLIEVANLSNDPDEYPKYFDLMTRQINAMEGFIREVTDYSRNVRVDLEFREIYLRHLVDTCVDSVRILAQNENIDVQVDIHPELMILSDPTRLRVVINNLLVNAIKYHASWKDDRYVKISATVENDQCHIYVKDNGMGIEPIYQEKIFDMFFRASTRSEGSGLGLYIVKETVDRIQGTIECISTLNEGSDFKIHIPMVTQVVDVNNSG